MKRRRSIVAGLVLLMGSALLAHHHTALDATGTPAYLEATGSRNARLYARHGYRPRRSYRITGDGPTLHPMWLRPGGAVYPSGGERPSVAGPS